MKLITSNKHWTLLDLENRNPAAGIKSQFDSGNDTRKTIKSHTIKIFAEFSCLLTNLGWILGK